VIIFISKEPVLLLLTYLKSVHHSFRQDKHTCDSSCLCYTLIESCVLQTTLLLSQLPTSAFSVPSATGTTSGNGIALQP